MSEREERAVEQIRYLCNEEGQGYSAETEKRDGGPAFPVAEDSETGRSFVACYGMTLRDWFAGQTLVGMLARETSVEAIVTVRDCAMKHGVTMARYRAMVAYEQADAMIEARDK